MSSTGTLTGPAVVRTPPEPRSEPAAESPSGNTSGNTSVGAKRRRSPARWAVAAGVVVVLGGLAYANRDAFDPSLWRAQLDLTWAMLAVVCSAATLAGNAWNLIGASPVRLRFWQTYAAQAAGTVARLVSPAAVGGAAVNVQFLRKAGVGSTAAVGTVSVAQSVQLVSALVLLPPVAVVAGLTLPGVSERTGLLAIVVGITVVALGVVAWLVVRRFPLLGGRVRAVLLELATSIRTMAARPSRALLSLAGALVISAGLIGALWASVHAFGGEIGLAAAACVLLFGSTAGNAIPVPGGLGTMDAALVAALVAAGVDLPIAIPAVALHRVLTLWLQVPAGLACAAWLRRTGAL